MAANVFQILQSRQTNGGKSAQHCCVYDCQSDSRYEEDPPVWFHHFPKDMTLRKTWLVKIRRDEGPFFKISKSTVVCSRHFLADDYKWTPVKRMLKPGAIPSKFAWSKPVNARSTTNRRPLEMSRDESTATGMEIDSNNSNNDDCSPIDISDDTTQEAEEQNVLQTFQIENEKLKAENQVLHEKLKVCRFGINRFSSDDSKIRFYTGFMTYQLFLAFFNWIQPTASNMRSMYYVQASENTSLAGRKRNMPLIDELFMCLCRIRLGLLEEDLSDRFECTVQTVSRKILTWLNYLYMYFVLGSIPLWLSRQQIDCLMPEDFKPKYSSTRVVLDCTEITCQIPSSLVLNSQAYSNYKSRTTFKSLIGIAPHGAMTFLSALYTGCMSDNEIVKLSGIRDLLEEGDSVMADKGFRLTRYFAEKNISLNMPPFLSSSDRCQFTPEQIQRNEEIASLRVHVERFNRRVKEYHIFDNDIPMSMVGSVNQLWSVACILSNFQGPLIAK